MTRILVTSSAFRNSKRVAVYLESDGEIGTSEIISRIIRSGKKCYLPVLHPMPPNKLWFCEYRPEERLITNKYGIPEPNRRKQYPVDLKSIDLVIMPLVAFDAYGTRLGMGGGYYDRTFSYMLHKKAWNRPRLIGIAHDFQKQKQIDKRPWDIAIEGVVTEQRFYKSDKK